MSFTLLLITLAVISAVLTYFISRSKSIEMIRNLIMSFLQFFMGLLFIVSGFVKAVDPLGTSYKMEEYFQEFQSLFETTWFSFINPLFIFLEHSSLFISIILILFEIVLGIMIIIGFKPKLTAWFYLLIVLLFAALTGYTYLTGYVPQGISFFDFGNWSEFSENNMKVTDCGCFGDFIKISAWNTFLKNVFFLIPCIYFIFRHKDMHQFFNGTIRWIVVVGSMILLYLFNLSNYSWNLPMVDFRPFGEGVNVREQLKLENEAGQATKELSIILKNKETGKVVDIPSEQYYATSDQFPTEIWTIKNRIYTEPTVPKTEISDMVFEDFEGEDLTEDILNYEDYSFMIVSWKMKGDPEAYTYKVKDTLFSIDTIFTADTIFVNDSIPYTNNDSFKIVKNIQEINDKEMHGYNYIWDNEYLKSFVKTINPIVEGAQNERIKVFAVVSATPDMVDDFIKDGGPNITYLNADDITLKTIIRSNPGVVLLKDGVIIKKWHYKKLPNFETIKKNYIK